MHVHDQVLEAANQLACGRADWSFGVDEVVRALPHLNESSVRTHVVSRCCVNAPKHHLHKWPYFRRVSRGRYQVEAAYRRQAPARDAKKTKELLQQKSRRVPGARREAIHAIIQRDGSVYVAECMELAVVTQGKTLDQVVENLQQALALHLEGEDMAALGLAEHPRVQLLYDTALAS